MYTYFKIKLPIIKKTIIKIHQFKTFTHSINFLVTFTPKKYQNRSSSRDSNNSTKITELSKHKTILSSAPFFPIHCQQCEAAGEAPSPETKRNNRRPKKKIPDSPENENART